MDEELVKAYAFVAERFSSKDPTKEELWAMCAKLQKQAWKLSQGQRKILAVLGKVATRADMTIAELRKSHQDYLQAAFETMPSGDVSDKQYRLRHIEEALKHFEMFKSKATTKRLLKLARDQEIIPKIEEQREGDENQTRLTRDEVWAFIQFIAGEK